MSNTRNTNWYTPRTRRRVVITSASILAGLTATSIPTLAQTSVTSAKENYTDKERDNLEAMKSYFDGLKSKDTSRIRFAPDVTFTTVIIPRPERGEAAVRELTQDFANQLLGIRVDRFMIDGDYGCARFEIDWSEKVVAHSIDYFQFKNGEIASIEVYWGPREFLAWSADRLRRPSRTKTCALLSLDRSNHQSGGSFATWYG